MVVLFQWFLTFETHWVVPKSYYIWIKSPTTGGLMLIYHLLKMDYFALKADNMPNS